MTIISQLLIFLFTVWVVCRAATWLPTYYVREEQVWITAVQNSHSTEIVRPESHSIGTLWRDFFSAMPPLNRWTLIAALSITLVAAGLWLNLLPGLMMAVWFVYACCLILLALVDFQTKLLPDVLTIPLIWLGLLVQMMPDTASFGLELAVIGAVLGYLPLWLLAQMYCLIRGRDGLGMGDLKLMAAMGAWSGPWILPQVIFAAAFFAIIWFLLQKFLFRRAGLVYEEHPFGPWLVLAYLLIIFFVC